MKQKKARKQHTAALKAKVGLLAVREQQTVNEIGQAHGVHPSQVHLWKKMLNENAVAVFERGNDSKSDDAHAAELQRLYAEIGKLTMHLEWLQKKSGIRLP